MLLGQKAFQYCEASLIPQNFLAECFCLYLQVNKTCHYIF